MTLGSPIVAPTPNHNALFVSPDGNTVALLASEMGASAAPEFIVFTNATTQFFSAKAVAVPSASAFSLACSFDVRYCLVVTDSLLWVYDTLQMIPRAKIAPLPPAPFGSYCFSLNGDYIAYGSNSMYFYSWNVGSNSYIPISSAFNFSGFIAQQCAVGPGGSVMVAWSNSDFTALYVTMLQISGDSIQLQWKYDLGVRGNSTSLPDVPSRVRVNLRGDIYAVTSWGNGGTAPTAIFFRSKRPEPFYSIMTPGSMNDVSFFSDGPIDFAAVGGSLSHNAQVGFGGQLFYIQLPI